MEKSVVCPSRAAGTAERPPDADDYRQSEVFVAQYVAWRITIALIMGFARDFNG